MNAMFGFGLDSLWCGSACVKRDEVIASFQTDGLTKEIVIEGCSTKGDAFRPELWDTDGSTRTSLGSSTGTSEPVSEELTEEVHGFLAVDDGPKGVPSTVAVSSNVCSNVPDAKCEDTLTHPVRSHSSILDECATVPFPKTPHGVKPIKSCTIDTTVGAVKRALDAMDGPFEEFMRDELGCSKHNNTAWIADNRASGNCVFRSSHYDAVPPADLPSVVKKLMGVPDILKGRSLYSLSCSEDSIVLLQQSFLSDVLYSDRFYLENTFCIASDSAGCTLSQWTEVIWKKPLPWTHSPATFFIDRKAKSEARATFKAFTQILTKRAKNVELRSVS